MEMKLNYILGFPTSLFAIEFLCEAQFYEYINTPTNTDTSDGFHGGQVFPELLAVL